MKDQMLQADLASQGIAVRAGMAVQNDGVKTADIL